MYRERKGRTSVVCLKPERLEPGSAVKPGSAGLRCATVLVVVLVCSASGQAKGGAGRHAAGGAIGNTGQDPVPSHGLERPGYLGVSLRDLDAAEATRLHKRGAMGAMIVTVDRDAPAWTAGLRPQDVVLEINGQTVNGVEALRRRLRECPAGDTITLRVRRGDDEMSYSVMLGDQQTIAQNALSQHLRPGPVLIPGPSPNTSLASSSAAGAPETHGTYAWSAITPLPAPPPEAAGNARGMASTLLDALIPGSTYTGLEVDPLTPQLAAFFGARAGGGLLVTAVGAGSPAASAGLTAGDVIVRAGNQLVSTRSALARALRQAKGNAVPLAVLRDHKETILSLLPGKRKKL